MCARAMHLHTQHTGTHRYTQHEPSSSELASGGGCWVWSTPEASLSIEESMKESTDASMEGSEAREDRDAERVEAVPVDVDLW